MKQSAALFSLLLITVAGFQSCNAQSIDNQSSSIATAFNTRNASALSEYFCATVELVLPDVDNTCSKVQAKAYVSEFFNKMQPRSFEILHQGSRANVSFIVGKLTTATALFRVNMLFKKEGGVLKIYQLRIE